MGLAGGVPYLSHGGWPQGTDDDVVTTGGECRVVSRVRKPEDNCCECPLEPALRLQASPTGEPRDGRERGSYVRFADLDRHNNGPVPCNRIRELDDVANAALPALEHDALDVLENGVVKAAEACVLVPDRARLRSRWRWIEIKIDTNN